MWKFVGRCLTITLLLVLLAAGGAHAAGRWSGYVVRVDDANCVSVSDRKGSQEVRARVFFYGIQAPTGTQPFAEQAMNHLRTLLPPGSSVDVEEVNVDDKGLTRAIVYARGGSVGHMLLQEGYAWVDRQRCKAMFCRRWMVQEHTALKARVGIWSLDLGTQPWQWGR